MEKCEIEFNNEYMQNANFTFAINGINLQINYNDINYVSYIVIHAMVIVFVIYSAYHFLNCPFRVFYLLIRI